MALVAKHTRKVRDDAKHLRTGTGFEHSDATGIVCNDVKIFYSVRARLK